MRFRKSLAPLKLAHCHKRACVSLSLGFPYMTHRDNVLFAVQRYTVTQDIDQYKYRNHSFVQKCSSIKHSSIQQEPRERRNRGKLAYLSRYNYSGRLLRFRTCFISKSPATEDSTHLTETSNKFTEYDF